MPLVQQNQLIAIFPKAPIERIESINDDWLCYADITTLTRLRYFLAQIGHESSGLTRVEENLRYSPIGLRKTWPDHFTRAQAIAYAFQPQRIANRAYANRNGNGPESSGYGWKYRGRGYIQTTGADNYAVVHEMTWLNCIENPDILLTPNGAMASSVVFWKHNNLNHYPDQHDFDRLTKSINGGLNGLSDRYKWLARVQQVI